MKKILTPNTTLTIVLTNCMTLRRMGTRAVPYFWNRQDEAFTWSYPGKIFASRKCRGEGVLAKKAVFCNFPWPPQKNFQMAVNRTILILESLPMAPLKAYVPNIPKHMRKRSQSLKLWVLDLSEVRWCENLDAQNTVFKAFFERKNLSRPNRPFLTP